MLSVKVPKEIKDYKEKIVGGMSLRQILFLSLAALAGGGAFALCVWVFGMAQMDATYIVAIAAIPLLLMGFVQKNGMPFERYFALILKYRFCQQKRPYISNYELPIRQSTQRYGGITREPLVKNVRKPKKEYRYEYAAERIVEKRKSTKARIRETNKRIKAIRLSQSKKGY